MPQAIFGYEAMSAVLAVLKQAGTGAGSRATVVSDFRTLHDRQSVLGTYSISSGDTTSRRSSSAVRVAACWSRAPARADAVLRRRGEGFSFC